MQADKSHVFLAVFDFGDAPDVVTSLLGFPPTTVWRVGDPLPAHPTAHRTHSRWVCQSPLPLHAHVEAHLEALLAHLEPFASRIRACAARFPTQLSCAIYYRDFTPGICLSPSAISRVAALGVALDFDLYFLDGSAPPPDT